MAFSRHHSGSAGVTGASHTSGCCCWGSHIPAPPPGSCAHLVLQSLAKETSFLADGMGGMWDVGQGGGWLSAGAEDAPMGAHAPSGWVQHPEVMVPPMALG